MIAPWFHDYEVQIHWYFDSRNYNLLILNYLKLAAGKELPHLHFEIQYPKPQLFFQLPYNFVGAINDRLAFEFDWLKNHNCR